MSTEFAKRQLEFGWSVFQKGNRADTLWANMQNFAKSQNPSVPVSYQNPLHGLKQLAKSGSLDSTTALQAFLLACELASRTKGLRHHVVLLTGKSAGLLSDSDTTATTATIEEARRRLNQKSNSEVFPAVSRSPCHQPRPPDWDKALRILSGNGKRVRIDDVLGQIEQLFDRNSLCVNWKETLLEELKSRDELSRTL